MRRLSRFALAFWFAVVALTAGAIEQNQLAQTVVTVALAEAGGQAVGHYMPDGSFMAGSMAAAANTGGHTHMGHADCEVCGALAAMAAFTLPSLGGIIVPPSYAAPLPQTRAPVLAVALPRAPFSSRGPPPFA